jgi:hypothetical protein
VIQTAAGGVVAVDQESRGVDPAGLRQVRLRDADAVIGQDDVEPDGLVVDGQPDAVTRLFRQPVTKPGQQGDVEARQRRQRAGLVLFLAFPCLDRGLVYQHQARGADKIITDHIDAHVEAERRKPDDDDGAAGASVPVG